MLATVLKQQGAIDEAIAHFRRAVDLQPTMAEGYLSLGQSLQQQGRAEEAGAALEQAQKLNQRKSDAQASTFAVSVGNRKLEAGDTAGAIRQYRDAIKLAPDNPQAHYRLAIALARQGARGEAQRAFDTARTLAPYLQPPAGLR